MAKYITISITLSILGLAYIGYDNMKAMEACQEKRSYDQCFRLIMR